MNVIRTAISEVLIIEPKIFGDHRGFFLETFKADRYAAQGVPGPFVQDNLSRSAHGVLRGLHLQHPRMQGKLVSVLRGRVRDVAVDVRIGSPTFGRHVAVDLSEENRRQLWVPRGFAHGFSQRSVFVGMALSQHREARVGSRSAWAAGSVVAAGSGRRTDCRHFVCASSRPDRICGMGHRA